MMQSDESNGSEGSTTVALCLVSLALIVLALFVWVSAAHADADAPAGPPALPFSPYGTVLVNGASPAPGIPVVAWCHAEPMRSALTTTANDAIAGAPATWYFNLDVPGDDPETSDRIEGCSATDIVRFRIGFDWADQEHLWVSGASPRLNLSCPPWDKSSLTLSGQCLPDGRMEFKVTNTGADMAGPTPWREYEGGVLAQSGQLQLLAGASQVFTFGPASMAIEFQVDQRPGHPGNSQPKLTLTCSPTAVTLSSFTATAGRRLCPLTGHLKCISNCWNPFKARYQWVCPPAKSH